MSKRTLIVVGLAAALLFVFFSNQVKRIAVGNTSAAIWKVGLTTVEIRTQTEILSGATIPIEFTNLIGSITYKGQYIGSFSFTKPFTIQPFQTSIVEVISKVSTFSLLSALGVGGLLNITEIKNWIETGDFTAIKNRLFDILKQINPAELIVSGTARAEGFSVNFKQPLLIS